MIDILDLLAADPNVGQGMRDFLRRTPIAVPGSDRWKEVQQDEREDQQRDERRAQLARGE